MSSNAPKPLRQWLQSVFETMERIARRYVSVIRDKEKPYPAGEDVDRYPRVLHVRSVWGGGIMDCNRCEYETGCFMPLRVLHHITGYPCRQGRKRKVLRQANIEEFKEVC